MNRKWNHKLLYQKESQLNLPSALLNCYSNWDFMKIMMIIGYQDPKKLRPHAQICQITDRSRWIFYLCAIHFLPFFDQDSKTPQIAAEEHSRRHFLHRWIVHFLSWRRAHRSCVSFRLQYLGMTILSFWKWPRTSEWGQCTNNFITHKMKYFESFWPNYTLEKGKLNVICVPLREL